ncbi:MAG: DMT family transporter [Candidatus Latescibacteria bacterium]|jgi:drug/metabolite transporter (DMT)-like permease|nr:DMT family transporter [Candidatus Latescibacterota bacterium]
MRLHPYVGLGIGILCLSWAAILIRMADAPPLIIGAFRLSMAALVLIPIAVMKSRRELLSMDRTSWLLAVFSGVMLSAHFASWMTSLSYTSVASSVVLVTTYPIFVGLVSHFFLKERISRGIIFGIAVASLGAMVIGYGDFGTEGDRIYGDGLAVIGAISGAGYFLIGARLRGYVSLLSYITIVYTTAAVLLMAMALAAGETLSGYSWTTYGIILLMALGPQLLGHSSLNWALRYLSAVFVSVSTLAEPVVATGLAYFILNEGVNGSRIAGSMLVLAGIYLVLSRRTSEIN